MSPTPPNSPTPQETLPPDLVAALMREGLEPHVIAAHLAALRGAIAHARQPVLKVHDTCRLDNGGILPLAPLARLAAEGTRADAMAPDVVAFVPAAGAASRYSQPLADVITALEASDDARAVAALAALRDGGAAGWFLPKHAETLVADPAALARLDAAGRAALHGDLQLPKALLPCVAEGTSFLGLKVAEHAALGRDAGLIGELFVAPVGHEGTFAATLAAEAAHQGATALPTKVLVQGPSLSTVRCLPDGTPLRDVEGHVSPVPAGHGALARLFPDVAAAFPAARSVFIRNVDNVMGGGADALAATRSFLAAHRHLLGCMTRIRSALARSDIAGAADVAAPLAALVAPATRQKLAIELAPFAPAERTLWEVQIGLFHSGVATAERKRERLTALYQRPLNVMGQVPNSGKDVGGTPCFVVLPSGTQKVCVELPHATPEDKATFFADPKRATHFNPVFVAAELTRDPEHYFRGNRDFWVLAAKTYKGQAVVYYETVLYELLGNSEFANCLFVEVPRLVFHPHKTLSDAAGRTLAGWGLARR